MTGLFAGLVVGATTALGIVLWYGQQQIDARRAKVKDKVDRTIDDTTCGSIPEGCGMTIPRPEGGWQRCGEPLFWPDMICKRCRKEAD